MLGTGQYILEERVLGEKLVFKLNREWWGYDPVICGGTPIAEPNMGFDTVTVLPITEEATRMAMLLSGEADAIHSLNYNNMDVIEAGGFAPLTESGVMVAFLYLNTQKGATADLRVRQAIAMSIDYDLLNEVVYGNRYLRGRSVNTPSINYYSEQPLYPVDLAKAKALLAEAGYDKGLTLTLWSQNDNTDIARAEFIQQQLSQVGVTVKVNTLEGGFLSENVNNYSGKPEDTEWDIYVRGYSVSSRDSDGSLGRFSSQAFPPKGANFPFYKNDRFDELVKAGASTTDSAKRAEYYAEAQSLIWNDFACVPMLIAMYTGATNPKTVEGLWYSGGGEIMFTHGRYVR